MKIILSKEDIEFAVRKTWGFPLTAELVYDLTPPIMDLILKGLSDLPEAPNNKISRIKRLREIYCDMGHGTLGLADAKFAIENFTAFRCFVEKNNRWPLPGYYNMANNSYVPTFK